MFGFNKRRRKRRRSQPFPRDWLGFLERGVPIYRRLPRADQDELRGHVQVLVAEKNFEGCGGLDMTDEIRVIVAGHAGILLLHRPTDYYPRLDSILVYPRAFVAETTVERLGPVAVRGEQVRAGEAWQRGVVILAWDGVLRAALNDRDGYNVAIHEFAHQLDMENGAADGYPAIADRALRAAWSGVFQREYDQLQHDITRRRRTLIDPYAAESPAEFFAVVTECFFEIPARLQRRHPDLYEALERFYRQDPAGLVSSSNLYT